MMLSTLSVVLAFGGLSLAQSTTTPPPTASDLAAAEVEALSALRPHASEQYSFVVSEFANAVAALPTGAKVSDLPLVISDAVPEVTAAAGDLASFISDELSMAGAPATLQAAAPTLALGLIQGVVPIAESLIGQAFPQSMALSEIPSRLIAVESVALAYASSAIPNLFLAAAPVVTAAGVEISALPSAVEGWVLGVQTTPTNTAGAAPVPATASSANVVPAPTAATQVTVSTAPGEATPVSAGNASSLTGNGTTVATAVATAANSTLAVIPTSSNPAVGGTSSRATVAGLSSASVAQQSSTSSAAVEQQTTNAGPKVVLGGEVLGLVGFVAGLALL